jgi:CBS domain containing-hemolysin-like protein
MSTSSKPPDPAANATAPARTTNGSWLRAVRTRLRLPGGVSSRANLEDALKRADGDEALSAEERGMMLRTMRFGALRVDDIMVPRADIIAIDENATIDDLLRAFDSAGVSRIPLFRETLDDPRGMVHVKDLVRWMMGDSQGRPPSEGRAAPVPKPQVPMVDESAPLPTIAAAFARLDLSRTIASARLRRQVLYVPPSMPAMSLLVRMQTQKMHMALVVDEYGGTDGLVTIEDLVEQIVGDIEDEHDEVEASNIHDDPKLGLIAVARTPIKELETVLGVKLLDAEAEMEIDTLGGLVFSLVGRVPSRSEVVRHPSGVEFEILDADPRRVKKVKVHRPRAARVAADKSAMAP